MTEIQTGCATCTHADRNQKAGWTCPLIKVSNYNRATDTFELITQPGRCPGVNITADQMAAWKKGCHGEHYEHDGSTKTCPTCGTGHSLDDTHCARCRSTLRSMLQAQVNRLQAIGAIR